MRQTNRVNLSEAKFARGDSKGTSYLAIPQIPILGKSNVGKSSLLNALCNQKKLARVSKSPGCTKQLNMFSVQDKVMLVDLPGYGFAKVSHGLKDSWGKLALNYLQSDNRIATALLLIDSRRGIKDNDVQAMDMLLACGRNFALVFTKVDKISQDGFFVLAEQANRLYNVNQSNIFFTSIKDKRSVQKLRNHILSHF